MRKITALLMSSVLALGLTACSSRPQGEGTTAESTTAESTTAESTTAENTTFAGSSTLVVYFSMPETTSTDESSMTEEERNSTVTIDGETLGNTQYVAYVIQKTTGADLFRIEPETPYPVDHDTLIDLAAEEQDSNARPAIKDQIENFDQYDTVFVGYPNWWSEMPMAMYSFFDEYDFSGKTVIPFSSHGGSGFSGTPAEIRSLEPGADVRSGYTVDRLDVAGDGENIRNWAAGLGL